MTHGPDATSGVVVYDGMREGRKHLIIENDLVKVILIPEVGRFPYDLLHKPIGRHLFIHPEPLSTPNLRERHVYYGGLVDCLPWVSGAVGGVADRGRFPEKGLLPTAAWQVTAVAGARTARVIASCRVSYPDPVTGTMSDLSVRKTVACVSDSPVVRMDYAIANEGVNGARFMFAAHHRVAAGGSWKAGDYFVAPGPECFVYTVENIPSLAGRGIRAGMWAKMPLPEVTEYVPGDEPRSVMAFFPSDWCAVGDREGNGVFFVGSRVRCGQHTRQMYMAVFMCHERYVVEPSLTRAVQARPETWKDPEETVHLEPGQACSFSVWMIPFSGLLREWVERASLVHDGRLLRLVVPMPAESLTLAVGEEDEA